MRTDNAHQERPTVALDSDTLSNTYVTYGVYIKTIRSIGAVSGSRVLYPNFLLDS